MNRPSEAGIEMIRRLVSFDTTSRESNLPLIQWVQDYLGRWNIPFRLTYDDDRRKANLFATLGPADKPGVILSGHTDVVPVDGQPWDTDPWALTEQGGKLYGRGTCDMKSFVALALASVPMFMERGLAKPIHLAFSYDEEVGCWGVRRLIEDLTRQGLKPEFCIVGEPTDMKVVVAHKGKTSHACAVRGLEAHSSLAHRGVNAVEYAAEVIAYLKAMARRFRDNGPFDRDYDPPYTTVHVGTVRGGTALNIVPLDCDFVFEFRYLPGHDPAAMLAEVKRYAEEKLLPEMRAVSPDVGFTWRDMSTIPGLDTEEAAEVTGFVKSLSGANRVEKVPYGTEAGLFQQAGIPTIICGPGSIDQAHKPNEFVTLEQIALGESFMARLADRVCLRPGA